MAFSLRLFRVGELQVPAAEVFFMARFFEWERLVFHMALAQGNGYNVLINTAPPDDMSYLNGFWQAWGESIAGEEGKRRLTMTLRPEERPLAHLSKVGLDPKDITHVVLSPFISYATGTLDLFPNAQICFNRRGWLEFIAPEHPERLMPREIYIPRKQLEYLLFEAWGRVRLLDDEDEIVPGITTFFAGVHHRSSLAVKIETHKGPAIFTDAAFHLKNVTDNIPIGILEHIDEAYDAYERIRREAAIVLPFVEPRLLEIYPDGVVA
jgi:hypothetical protein